MALPAILCLHGSGVNSSVFKIQTAALQNLLSQTFDFVFISGPFETSAGFGVLPYFSGAEPFFRWKSKTDDNIFDHEEIEPEVQKLIDETLKTRNDWIGIMGFSQGGRLAAGLLVEQERKEEMGEIEDEAHLFKFGVFLNTPSPPMTEVVYEKDVEISLQTPSVLIVGTKDHWYESGKTLYEKYFEKETAKVVEIDVDHRIPSASADVMAIAREILRLYMVATGVRGTLNR